MPSPSTRIPAIAALSTQPFRTLSADAQADAPTARATLGALARLRRKGAANGVARWGGLEDRFHLPAKTTLTACWSTRTWRRFRRPVKAGRSTSAIDTNKTYRWGGSAYVVISRYAGAWETSLDGLPPGGSWGDCLHPLPGDRGNPHGRRSRRSRAFPRRDTASRPDPALGQDRPFAGRTQPFNPLSAFGRSLRRARTI